MNTCRFGRYVEQFGLECIERNHKEGLVLFTRIWTVIFAVLSAFTISAFAMNTYPQAWMMFDCAVLAVFALCGWQRYQLHKLIQSHRELQKSPA